MSLMFLKSRKNSINDIIKKKNLRRNQADE